MFDAWTMGHSPPLLAACCCCLSASASCPPPDGEPKPTTAPRGDSGHAVGGIVHICFGRDSPARDELADGVCPSYLAKQKKEKAAVSEKQKKGKLSQGEEKPFLEAASPCGPAGQECPE